MAKCRKCGELLHTLMYLGRDAGAKQCLNGKCPKYGQRV